MRTASKLLRILQLHETYPETRFTLMGDSAGGGLATALALKLRGEGLPQPDLVLLICPFLDADLSNPEIPSVEPADPLLSAPGLRAWAEQYAADREMNDPLVSPLHGEMAGLTTRIRIYTAENDILRPDAMLFYQKAKAAGIDITYQEYAGMLHNWFLAPLPEAKQLMKEISTEIES